MSQNGSSKSFKRPIVFSIISIALVVLVVVGVVVVKDITAGNQIEVAVSPTAIPTQNGKVRVTCYSECGGFAAAFWHQYGSVYE